MRLGNALPYFPLLGTLLACSGSKNPVHQALDQKRPETSTESAMAFRFPGSRSADTRVYILPTLEEVAWQFRTSGLIVDRIVGYSAAQDQVYLVTPERNLAALDLTTGRVRTLDSSIVQAALGPTGRLHLVRGEGTVGAIEHRNISNWPFQIEDTAVTLWGAGAGRLVALTGSENGDALTLLAPGKPAMRRSIPEGAVLDVAMWGDAVALAVDSGVLQFDPADTVRTSYARLAFAPSLIAIAPAGHRIYVASAEGRFAALDRFSGQVLNQFSLPGAAREFRLDDRGRILLARPSTGDSIWVIDLLANRLKGSVPGLWRPDLPAVSHDGTLLVARQEDVVALRGDSLTASGRVAGGASDRWLIAAWDARRPGVQLVSDTSAAPAAESSQELFVQVSSTSNQAWAEDLARSLRQAGMQAHVLPPSSDEERYRVVLGPYRTREEADDIGRKLGRPFWIFSRERQTAR